MKKMEENYSDSFKETCLYVQNQLITLEKNIETFIKDKDRIVIDDSEEDINDSFYQMKNMFVRYKEYKEELFDRNENADKQILFKEEQSMITLNNYKKLFSYYTVYECSSSSLIIIILSGMMRFLKRISNHSLFFKERGTKNEIT